MDSTASNPGPFESRQDIQWKKSKKLFLRPVKHFCGSSKTTEAYRCPKCEDIYEGYFYQNWVLLQSMIDYCSGHESRRWIKTEYTSGSDLYHGLGAARVACGLGWATAVAYDLIIRPFIHPDTPWIIKVVSDMGWGGLCFGRSL
ncbi:hypothetical protein [Paenarthrobacter aromaticivorans]|uniref:hypothetical protein n=1 Tax=Paenarthrobacter aromaticivorans TaxID=2849150 RepID=UPI003A80B384